MSQDEQDKHNANCKWNDSGWCTLDNIGCQNAYSSTNSCSDYEWIEDREKAKENKKARRKLEKDIDKIVKICYDISYGIDSDGDEVGSSYLDEFQLKTEIIKYIEENYRRK